MAVVATAATATEQKTIVARLDVIFISSPLSYSSNAPSADRIGTGCGVQTPPPYGNFVMVGRSFYEVHTGYSIGIPAAQALYACDKYLILRFCIEYCLHDKIYYRLKFSGATDQ